MMPVAHLAHYSGGWGGGAWLIGLCLVSPVSRALVGVMPRLRDLPYIHGLHDTYRVNTCLQPTPALSAPAITMRYRAGLWLCCLWSTCRTFALRGGCMDAMVTTCTIV